VQWGFLVQTLVRTRPVVIGEVLLEHPRQVHLVQDDQVVEALLAEGVPVKAP
jgi:hypothetical protein